MKNSVLLLLTLLFISCHSEKKKDFGSEKVNDSIGHYFLESQNLKHNLSDRLKAIDRALELSRNDMSQQLTAKLGYQKIGFIILWDIMIA